MAIKLFPNLQRISIKEHAKSNNYEDYIGVVLDKRNNTFKVVEGQFTDKKDMYRKMKARGLILRKAYERKVWEWIEANADGVIISYLMLSTAFSKWRSNNVLHKYYEKLLNDIPELNREREKGNPNTRGGDFITTDDRPAPKRQDEAVELDEDETDDAFNILEGEHKVSFDGVKIKKEETIDMGELTIRKGYNSPYNLELLQDISNRLKTYDEISVILRGNDDFFLQKRYDRKTINDAVKIYNNIKKSLEQDRSGKTNKEHPEITCNVELIGRTFAESPVILYNEKNDKFSNVLYLSDILLDKHGNLLDPIITQIVWDVFNGEVEKQTGVKQKFLEIKVSIDNNLVKTYTHGSAQEELRKISTGEAQYGISNPASIWQQLQVKINEILNTKDEKEKEFLGKEKDRLTFQLKQVRAEKHADINNIKGTYQANVINTLRKDNQESRDVLKSMLENTESWLSRFFSNLLNLSEDEKTSLDRLIKWDIKHNDGFINGAYGSVDSTHRDFTPLTKDQIADIGLKMKYGKPVAEDETKRKFLLYNLIWYILADARDFKRKMVRSKYYVNVADEVSDLLERRSRIGTDGKNYKTQQGDADADVTVGDELRKIDKRLRKLYNELKQNNINNCYSWLISEIEKSGAIKFEKEQVNVTNEFEPERYVSMGQYEEPEGKINPCQEIVNDLLAQGADEDILNMARSKVFADKMIKLGKKEPENFTTKAIGKVTFSPSSNVINVAGNYFNDHLDEFKTNLIKEYNNLKNDYMISKMDYIYKEVRDFVTKKYDEQLDKRLEDEIINAGAKYFMNKKEGDFETCKKKYEKEYKDEIKQQIKLRKDRYYKTDEYKKEIKNEIDNQMNIIKDKLFNKPKGKHNDKYLNDVLNDVLKNPTSESVEVTQYDNDGAYQLHNSIPYQGKGFGYSSGPLKMTGQIVEDTTKTELNPNLFENDLLIPEVRDALYKIAMVFKDYLDLPFEVKDIYFTGSNANYNYTDDSDIDLHLVYDFEQAGVNAELLSKYLVAAKKDFNDKYDIKVKGMPVELGCENIAEPLVSTGVYSLGANAWVIKPNNAGIEIPDVDMNAFNDLSTKIDDTIKAQNASAIENLWKSIKSLRKNSLADEGEFGMGNMLFKKLRNSNYLEKLRNSMYDTQSKDLSLESSEKLQEDELNKKRDCSEYLKDLQDELQSDETQDLLTNRSLLSYLDGYKDKNEKHEVKEENGVLNEGSSYIPERVLQGLLNGMYNGKPVNVSNWRLTDGNSVCRITFEKGAIYKTDLERKEIKPGDNGWFPKPDSKVEITYDEFAKLLWDNRKKPLLKNIEFFKRLNNEWSDDPTTNVDNVINDQISVTNKFFKTQDVKYNNWYNKNKKYFDKFLPKNENLRQNVLDYLYKYGISSDTDDFDGEELKNTLNDIQSLCEKVENHEGRIVVGSKDHNEILRVFQAILNTIFPNEKDEYHNILSKLLTDLICVDETIMRKGKGEKETIERWWQIYSISDIRNYIKEDGKLDLKKIQYKDIIIRIRDANPDNSNIILANGKTLVTSKDVNLFQFELILRYAKEVNQETKNVMYQNSKYPVRNLEDKKYNLIPLTSDEIQQFLNNSNNMYDILKDEVIELNHQLKFLDPKEDKKEINELRRQRDKMLIQMIISKYGNTHDKLKLGSDEIITVHPSSLEFNKKVPTNGFTKDDIVNKHKPDNMRKIEKGW